MQDFESNSIALYNQQTIQILCSDTLELEIELARDMRQSSVELPPTPALLPQDQTFYSTWVRDNAKQLFSYGIFCVVLG